MASVYPSSQWSVVKGPVLPMFAASDIVQGAPVCVASSADWGVIMCTSSAQKPIGVARDYVIQGNAVAVYAPGNVVRTSVAQLGAAGSFSRQSYVGVAGTSTVTHPQSGVTVTVPVIAQVSGTGSIAIGASTAAVYAIGVAFESSAIGDAAAFHVEPRLLSGIVNSN